MAPRSKTQNDGADEDVSMNETPVSHQPEVVEDASMVDAASEQGDLGSQFGEEETEEIQRVKLLPGSTPQAASFEFLEEGHTLGNALRYVIMKNPDVEFCAYAIPHPSEFKMNVRIQTYEGTAIEALEKGLRDIQDLCDVVTDKFIVARDSFAERMAS